jgi:hypothetical protein
MWLAACGGRMGHATWRRVEGRPAHRRARGRVASADITTTLPTNHPMSVCAAVRIVEEDEDAEPIGLAADAARITSATAAVLSEGRQLTRDLGGNVGTRAMADAIIARL